MLFWRFQLTLARPFNVKAIQANLSNFRSLLPKPQKVPRGGARAVEVESTPILKGLELGDLGDFFFAN